MNNKGFAYTTIIYSIVLMLGLSMLVVLAIVSTSARNNKDFGLEIETELEQCFQGGTC